MKVERYPNSKEITPAKDGTAREELQNELVKAKAINNLAHRLK